MCRGGLQAQSAVRYCIQPGSGSWGSDTSLLPLCPVCVIHPSILPASIPPKTPTHPSNVRSHTHTHTHTHTRTHMQTHTHAHTNTRTHKHTQTHVDTRTRTHEHARTHTRSFFLSHFVINKYTYFSVYFLATQPTRNKQLPEEETNGKTRSLRTVWTTRHLDERSSLSIRCKPPYSVRRRACAERGAGSHTTYSNGGK